MFDLIVRIVVTLPAEEEVVFHLLRLSFPTVSGSTTIHAIKSGSFNLKSRNSV
jgi:hypothetical protein